MTTRNFTANFPFDSSFLKVYVVSSLEEAKREKFSSVDKEKGVKCNHLSCFSTAERVKIKLLPPRDPNQPLKCHAASVARHQVERDLG